MRSLVWAVPAAAAALALGFASGADRSPLNPAAWGSDHVGKALPRFDDGGSCLFCHRGDVGPSWNKNIHQQTVRGIDDAPDIVAAFLENADLAALAAEARYVLGGEHRAWLLKPLEQYGKVAILSTPMNPQTGQVEHVEDARWDGRTFAASCAGCHASAVEADTRAFQTLSVECHTCHGVADAGHAADPSRMLLSRESTAPAAVTISICASCHVRTGRSRSTELPYPNQFVPGDNLFRDFEVDLSDEALARENPGERHILENIRDVVVLGHTEVTCVSCHDVHGESSAKHARVRRRGACFTCHHETGEAKVVKSYEAHSALCRY